MENIRVEDLNLRTSRIISDQDRVKIHLTRLNSGEQIIVKEQSINDITNTILLQKEYSAWSKLNHKNIIKIHHPPIIGRKKLLFTMMSYYPEGDLANEISKRSQSNNYWKQDELLSIWKDLVSGFAYTQEEKLPHKNIKPENILKNGNQYLISGLGHSHKLYEENNLTAESPKYLSPVLRNAFICYSIKYRTHPPVQNDYKSDVFSLGLTFMFMASLEDIESLAHLDPNIYNIVLESRLSKLRYNDSIKSILKSMLEFDENQRHDFISLDNFMNTSTAPSDKQSFQEICNKPRNPVSTQSLKHCKKTQNPNPNTEVSYDQIYQLFKKKTSEKDVVSITQNHNRILFKWVVKTQNIKKIIDYCFSEIIFNSNNNLSEIIKRLSQYYSLRVTFSDLKFKCKYCNNLIEDEYRIKSPKCGGYIHYQCIQKYGRYFRKDSYLYLVCYCQTCNSNHEVLYKKLISCYKCKNLTMNKNIFGNFCLDCLSQSNTPFFVLVKSISKEVIEGGLCEKCFSISDVFINEKHYYCYKCLISSKSNGNFSSICLSGCCIPNTAKKNIQHSESRSCSAVNYVDSKVSDSQKNKELGYSTAQKEFLNSDGNKAIDLNKIPTKISYEMNKKEEIEQKFSRDSSKEYQATVTPNILLIYQVFM